jgi:ABC-type nitrate/sulfonate/bicarbonate transport system permease component
MPSCVPYIFAGLQVSLASSWMAVLAAEMVSSTEGAGWVIVAGSENGDIVQIFVGIIAISMVGLLIATGMRQVEQFACRWKAKAR